MTSILQAAVDDVFRRASVAALDRIRCDRERAPSHHGAFYATIERELFSSEFDPEAAWRDAGDTADPLLDASPGAYIEELRTRTALRMLEIGDGRIPTGRAALVVGLGSYLAFRRACERWIGGVPEMVRFAPHLHPRFDPLSWHRAQGGDFASGARSLGVRLRRLYPTVLDPATAATAAGTAGPQRQLEVAKACAVTSGSDLEQALERAGRRPRQRLRQRAQGLPREIVRVLADIADHLFDPDLSVDVCRRRLGLRDTALTTKVRFFVGDTLADGIEKRRIETALALVADERWTIEQVSEAVGLSYRRFCRAFKRRTGATPSQVRKTLRRSTGDPAFDLWCRAEHGELASSEVRQLAETLRALAPEAIAEPEPQQLAVRRDVDPRRVEEVIRLVTGVDPGAQRLLHRMLRTHADSSAAHWYVHWVHQRLGRATLEQSWVDWQSANRRLIELLAAPKERRPSVVAADPKYHGDAFFWLLVDSATVRLMQDAVESEHYVDLALAATEVPGQGQPRAGGEARHALALAFHGNALRRKCRLEEAKVAFEKALEGVRSVATEPWLEGRIYSLHASLLDRLGQVRQARRCLTQAASLMKRAGDELERIRLVIKRATILFAAGQDLSRPLTWCIAALRRFPFASDLHQSAHVARLLARIYLADRLSGSKLAEIRALRAAIPLATSPFLMTTHRHIDGLIFGLEGGVLESARVLQQTARWYEENNFLADAAVCWLEYAWVLVDVDPDSARQAALTSHLYMARTGFNGYSQQQISQQIYLEARERCLRRETLRLCILDRVCPKRNARLVF